MQLVNVLRVSVSACTQLTRMGNNYRRTPYIMSSPPKTIGIIRQCKAARSLHTAWRRAPCLRNVVSASLGIYDYTTTLLPLKIIPSVSLKEAILGTSAKYNYFGHYSILSWQVIVSSLPSNKMYCWITSLRHADQQRKNFGNISLLMDNTCFLQLWRRRELRSMPSLASRK